MAIDRAEALNKAEKLLRQGKLDLAIAEYERLLEEQPRDWNTRNTLGDLYVRASQPAKAVAQYEQIADHLFTEGFFSKAAALYKKILKITPDEESVLLHLGEVSATQGLLADAKGYFLAVANKRRRKGDRAGADEINIRLGSLDPSDFDARTLAAQTLETNGDLTAAAAHYRSMHADLQEKKRHEEALGALRQAVRLNPEDAEGRGLLAKVALDAGDIEGARPYLDRALAGEDPALLMPLLDMEIRAGRFDQAREILAQLLRIDVAWRSKVVEFAWTLAPVSPEGALVCIDAAVDSELASGNHMDAAAILQELVTRVPGQIAALQKLVEICVDGGLEAVMYEAQAHLADAYLERGQGAEARVIAEDLVAREPWEHAHIDRFRRALVLLDVSDPDVVIADRLSGQGPFVATDPFMAGDSLNESEPITPGPVEPQPAELEPTAAEATEPDIPLRPRQPEASAPASKKETPDVDLIDEVSDLDEVVDAPATPAAPPPSARNLDAVFKEFRAEVSRQTGANEAAEYLGLGKTYLEMEMTEEAINALRIAARAPAQRFEAASLLGRLYLKNSDLLHAIEWLERAAEAPAPGVNEARALLYELGSLLESAGESSRALAVFLELQADAGDYREVAAHVERLTRVQAGD